MQTRAQYEEAKAFANIFDGANDRYGIYNGKDAEKEYDSIRKPLTLDLINKHLAGEISLARVLITNDGKCKAGVIDFDDHKKGGIKKKFDYDLLQKKIKFFNFPLNIIQSKTGGAHAWLFLDNFYPAKWIRYKLKKFAYQLVGHTNIEMFPKQDALSSKDFGSLINLPYYKGNSRQLLDLNGKALNVEEMLKIAPSRVRKYDDLKPFDLLSKKEFPDGRNNRTFSATTYLKKHYADWKERVVEYNKIFFDDHSDGALSDRELEQTVISSNEKKNYANPEPEDTPKELITYSMSAYKRLGIKKPIFIIEGLIKEKSMNFLFGPKGNLKTEITLGLINALTRGKPFLHYDCPYPYPIFWGDFEMGGYDLIERDELYAKKYGGEVGDLFHILQWEQQTDQNIPDIAGELGQDLIIKGLEKQKKLVGKPPLFVLDNLRSASGYNENDSDAWRPIGKWLLKLRGLGYPTLVLDHTGYDETHMRGTSSKSDWANVCLGINARSSKGSKVAVVDLHFDKARGLRPDETERFSAQYDFNGNWTLAQSKKDENDDKLMAEIIVLQAKDPKVTQATLSEALDKSTGKISQLMKKIKTRGNY